MRFLHFSSLSLATSVFAQTSDGTRQCETSCYDHKHRVFVARDMSNKPDDQMSLVRFLTYANELDIQGIAGTTSIHKNDSVDGNNHSRGDIRPWERHRQPQGIRSCQRTIPDRL
ncbi:DUF1593-domain-containing protein [Macroventuria anomochaeta]|uniref:DUF1593-domain-containing protein n=1 Tax=Macroventuria anomochaeta TaxID=301207 RepID=A0ACB6RX20_9PLEO|nr:DUF1593-domain-containing protein [Macroventuria anomochaeta]KAF2626520.1 DUF1593-domain-containing protein [Macroventuria anomochaeta]